MIALTAGRRKGVQMQGNRAGRPGFTGNDSRDR